jgi:hypothetical protein
MKQGTIKIQGREIVCTGSADKINRVNNYIHTPEHVQSEQKSGDFCTMIIFGQAWNWSEFPVELKAQFDVEFSTFVAVLPAEITARMTTKDLPDNSFYRKYIPTEESLKVMREARKTPEDLEKEKREKLAQDARNEENRKTNEAKKAQDQANHDKYLVEYAYLARVSNDESARITATKNIRALLSRQFPGTCFSVTSKTFANGDAIRIKYTDGPAYNKIDAIGKKFQPYDSDESGDFWDYHGTPFASLFGDAKFVTVSREISPEVNDAWKFEIKAKYNWADSVTEFERNNFERRDFNAMHAERDVEPLPGSASPVEPATNTCVVIRKNEEHNGIEVKFSAKPAPDVIEWLKGHGFRWSMRCKIWYTKYNEAKERQTRERFSIA